MKSESLALDLVVVAVVVVAVVYAVSGASELVSRLQQLWPL